MIALLDANLFVPTWIIDPLLSLAEAGLCEPAWSARVMDETVVPEKLRTLDYARPWRDDQFASTRLSSSRDISM